MKPMTEDLPYPDLSKLAPDRKNARIIMPAYADVKSELTAVLQYIYQSILFGVCGKEDYAATLERIAIAEMKHLDLLGEALARMGAAPVYSRRPPEKCEFYSSCAVAYPTQPVEMIAADITAETEAIADYECMLERITEPTLGALISRIVLDERMHLKAFKDMYCELING
ncbi:MAG: hypothetical protein HFJ22_07415 [Clostridia bacterium]|jgi:bacterioferritin|nr:hypothetical protein [Clostridia bacterium]